MLDLTNIILSCDSVKSFSLEGFRIMLAWSQNHELFTNTTYIKHQHIEAHVRRRCAHLLPKLPSQNFNEIDSFLSVGRN